MYGQAMGERFHLRACQGLLLLMLLLHPGERGRSAEGSVTNSAANFLGSLQPPEGREFRLKADWVHELPYDMDQTLLLAPPDLPEGMLDPYFDRVDFQPALSAAQRYIADKHLLGASPFYRGSALPDVDPLMRKGPFQGVDGPLPSPTQAFLTSTKSLPLGHNFNLRQTYHSAVDQPVEDDYGDIAAFLREASNRLGVGDQTRNHFQSPLTNPFDAFELKHFDVAQSRVVRAMRTQIDEDIIHPDDRIASAHETEQPVLQAGVSMAATPQLQGAQPLPAPGGHLLRTSNQFAPEHYEMNLKFAAEPLMMQYQRAAHISKLNPATDMTLNPVVTGGVCIGFRCSDGVVLAADTMLCQGSYHRFLDARRLHKISDTIVMAADGEYADFQQMQSMFLQYTEEYDHLEPHGTYRVYPSQAFYFLHKVMYAKRCKQDPFWNSVLIGGYDLRTSIDTPVVGELDQEPEPFLGHVDMQGTPYEGHILATGFGNYMALPLMRIATREAEHLQNQTQPKVLTMAEATRWAKDVMRVLSLRSAQCSNRIQIATVGADGVDISAPFEVEGNWEIDGFYSSEKGNLYQPNATVADLHPY